MSKDGHFDILCRIQLVTFDYPDWGFPCIFPQLYGECQGRTCTDGARPALFPGMAASLSAWISPRVLTLDMTNLGLNPRKNLPAEVMPPHKGLLPPELWSSVCPLRILQPRRETRHCNCNSRCSLRSMSLGPSMRLNIMLTIQTEGRQLALSHTSLPLSYLLSWLSWFFGWFGSWHSHSDYSVVLVARADVIGASCAWAGKRVVSNYSRKLPRQKSQFIENRFLISENIYQWY